MFKFISDKIKFKKIVDMQFRQHIIFMAHDIAMDYIEKEIVTTPNPAYKFEVSFNVSDNKEVLGIVLNIDDNEYHLDINTKTETAPYFINVLEAIYSFKLWDTLVYVSATDNPNDFLFIRFSPRYFRIIGILNANKKPQYIDTLIGGMEILDKLVVPLVNCEPFGKYMLNAKKLYHCSPKKVKLPFFYSRED